MKKIDINKVKNYLTEHLHTWLPFTIIIVAAVIICAPFAFEWLNVNNDYASGGINTLGNTTGNISNNSIVCQQGDWLYFRNDDDNKTLYKCKTDGSMIQQVVNDPGVSNINVVGEWIYYRYMGIWKVRTDGVGRVLLTESNSAYLNVVGDWIYFANFSDNCYLYKIKTDGTHMTKIADMSGEGVNVVDGFIYINDRYNTRNLYKLSVDAEDISEAVPIAQNVYVFNVVGDWIYYSDAVETGTLYKIRIDGSEKTKLADVSARVVLSDGNKVYYIDSASSDHLFSINVDGTDRRLIAETDCMNINLASGYIFYSQIHEGDMAPIHKLYLYEGMGTPI